MWAEKLLFAKIEVIKQSCYFNGNVNALEKENVPGDLGLN